MSTISTKPSLHSLLLIIIFIISSSLNFSTVSSDSDSDLIAELLNLQNQSNSGLIHLDDKKFNRFLTSAESRSYSLIIFFDAIQLHNKKELHLKDLHSIFNNVSYAFISSNKGTPAQSKLFFCDLEFQESKSSFDLLGINYLPHIRHVGAQLRNLKDSEQMEHSEFGRLPESMVDFVKSNTNLTFKSEILPLQLKRGKKESRDSSASC